MKLLEKNNLIDVLKYWAGKYCVLTPSKKEQGDCIFETFDEMTFTLDYGKPSMPQKSSLLPQSEVTFEIDNGTYKETLQANDTLLFGIRACDLMGIRQTHNFMMRDNDDKYFTSKMDKCISVVMACKGPQNKTCFCTTTNSGPFAEKGFDLQFYDMGDTFIVETGSNKGEELILGKYFKDVDELKARGKIDAFKKKAQENIPIVDEVKKAMTILADGTADENVWEYLGKKCIACGSCVFVCPTCTCFNVYDLVVEKETGQRIRVWDACLYGGFTKEASGHNPRPTQASRVKRRYEHKLLYYNKDDIQEAICGCVGCGRCTDFCPVNIGTLEVVKFIVNGGIPYTFASDRGGQI